MREVAVQSVNDTTSSDDRKNLQTEMDALVLKLTTFILVNSRPSIEPSPSAADLEITQQFLNAAEALDLRMREYLIIEKCAELNFAPVIYSVIPSGAMIEILLISPVNREIFSLHLS